MADEHRTIILKGPRALVGHAVPFDPSSCDFFEGLGFPARFQTAGRISALLFVFDFGL